MGNWARTKIEKVLKYYDQDCSIKGMKIEQKFHAE